MNDKLLFENYLLILKSTTEVYVHGTLESSNKDVRSLLKESLNTILTNQADTYDLMKNNGWYQTSNINSFKIKETLHKLENN